MDARLNHACIVVQSLYSRSPPTGLFDAETLGDSYMPSYVRHV